MIRPCAHVRLLLLLLLLLLPPGHHAGPEGPVTHDTSCGFCVFNYPGLATSLLKEVLSVVVMVWS